MLLLPKLAQQREFDPCESWAAASRRGTSWHKQRNFGNNGLTKIWDFVGLNFFLVKILWPDPLLHYKTDLNKRWAMLFLAKKTPSGQTVIRKRMSLKNR